MRFNNELVASVDYERLDTPENMMTLLVDTGYLCPINFLDDGVYEIKIPNKEVLYGYKDMIDTIVGASAQSLWNLK